MKKALKFIDGKDLTLDEFLQMLLSPAKYLLLPNNQFPTDEMLNEFLRTIKIRSDREIKDILHAFFLKNSTFKIDLVYKETYKNMNWDKFHSKPGIRSDFEHTEYIKRVIGHEKVTDTIWEGITWIIDLLPHFPNEALTALDAWYLANCQFLPDSFLSAAGDWTALIRAKYVDFEVPQDVFMSFQPEEFEYLIAELYERLGYKTEVTRSTRDGGVDVVAIKENTGAKETLIVQCKRYKKSVGVAEIRNLLGVISDKKATKGTLVASCRFTREAQRFAESNSSIELIDNKQLGQLLNLHLGSLWSVKRDNYFMNQKKKLKKAS